MSEHMEGCASHEYPFAYMKRKACTCGKEERDEADQSDAKDAEIARLREQVASLREFADDMARSLESSCDFNRGDEGLIESYRLTHPAGQARED